MTVDSSTLATGARGALPLVRVPALFASTPLDPATAIGRLFAPEWRDRSAEKTALMLGSWRAALGLLPPREQRRASLFATWAACLDDTVVEGDSPDRRVERLHRSAFVLAKAFVGEPTSSPFARLIAEESSARKLPRRSLDVLLAETRARIFEPRAGNETEWRRRTRAFGGACAEALLGQEPTPSTVDAAAALYRLALLTRLPDALRRGRCQLPGTDRRPDSEAISAELAEIRAQLLRGARALAEVPLGFRRALAYLIAAALDLVGRIEERPAELLQRAPKVGFWRRRLTLWRARRTPV